MRRLWVATAMLGLAAPAFTQAPQAPDWAYPESPTHHQVAPPPDFHRPPTTEMKRIGAFDGQTEIGSAIAPGSSSYDPATRTYRITASGYNVWYTRDEFRYLWKKMSGDVSLAATIDYPDKNGFFDRKAVLVIRQSLDDDSKEALVALHGDGLIHIAYRPGPGQRVRDMEYRVGSRGDLPGGKSPDSLVVAHARRIGIEKHGDQYQLYVSLLGEPIHAWGPPITLPLDGPFYVGIGFCSHQPTTLDTALLSDIVVENRAGAVR
jgi:hypothetical protein